MPFVTVPGLKGKVYIPEKQSEIPKKHPCKDCYSCQHCSDDRCGVCLGQQNPKCKKHRDIKLSDMTPKAFQDYYPDEFATCYGCGRLNQHGLQIKSYWDGEESICRFRPHPHHTGGFPGYVYGGLIASLIDCHGAGTASAAKSRHDGKNMETDPPFRFVTEKSLFPLHFRQTIKYVPKGK